MPIYVLIFKKVQITESSTIVDFGVTIILQNLLYTMRLSSNTTTYNNGDVSCSLYKHGIVIAGVVHDSLDRGKVSHGHW
jgi:hypothetical protein